MSERFSTILVHVSFCCVYPMNGSYPLWLLVMWFLVHRCDVYGLFSICDLKVTQMNVQCSLIQKFILYKYKLYYNTKATKGICFIKGKFVLHEGRWTLIKRPLEKDPEMLNFVSYISKILQNFLVCCCFFIIMTVDVWTE